METFGRISFSRDRQRSMALCSRWRPKGDSGFATPNLAHSDHEPAHAPTGFAQVPLRPGSPHIFAFRDPFLRHRVFCCSRIRP